MENWKFINEKYEISNTGKLRKGSFILKGRIGKHGYIEYSMYLGNRVRKYELAHRLVAKAFIENSDNKTEVNHKDFDKTNNCVENLEWCTHSENIKYSRGLNRYPKEIKKRTNKTLIKDRKAKEHKMKAVIDEMGNSVMQWKFNNAIINKFQCTDLYPKSNELAIESLYFVY